MVLTAENYYTNRNTALTTSKILTYRKSKALYIRRFIDCVPKSLTPSMKIGKAVDSLLTGLPSDVHLTDAQRCEVNGLVSEIKRHPFWKDLEEKSEKQMILTGKLGRIDFAGRPDFITVKGKTVFIDDLKISSPAKVRNWYWTALERGYEIQLAVYRELCRQKFPDKSRFVCRHIVAWKEEEDLYRVKLFTFPDEMLRQGWKIFAELAKKLAKEKNWKDPLIKWRDSEVLERPASKMAVEETEG